MAGGRAGLILLKRRAADGLLAGDRRPAAAKQRRAAADAVPDAGPGAVPDARPPDAPPPAATPRREMTNSEKSFVLFTRLLIRCVAPPEGREVPALLAEVAGIRTFLVFVAVPSETDPRLAARWRVSIVRLLAPQFCC